VPDSLPGTTLTSGISSTDTLQAIFSARSTVQRMLDVEAALAHALATAGVIPSAAVDPWVRCCDADQIDINALRLAVPEAGNIAIPLVKQLTANVAAIDADAARYVHLGATSQDLIDTAKVLQLRDAVYVITNDLVLLADVLALLARRYRDTPMIGRTWLQHALPITFGLKVAGWLDALLRHQQRVHDMSKQLRVLQFGGASGTLASLGDHALAVSQSIADQLDLTLPSVPWHAHRDIALMSQTEVAELSEPDAPGRGGSSSMPHKRNPVGCAAVLSAATRVPGLVATMLSAMPNEHERALGGWQAEWETLPEIVSLSAAALAQLSSVTARLQVDTERMRSNIDASRGMVMAEAIVIELAHGLGRAQAHQLVEAACRKAYSQRQDLLKELQAEPQVTDVLSKDRLAQLFDPLSYIGQAGAYVDRVLETYEKHKA
jgi:3-carboxy-cis,cis-muconate cycloisomerase